MYMYVFLIIFFLFETEWEHVFLSLKMFLIKMAKLYAQYHYSMQKLKFSENNASNMEFNVLLNHQVKLFLMVQQL